MHKLCISSPSGEPYDAKFVYTELEPRTAAIDDDNNLVYDPMTAASEESKQVHF